MTIATVIALNLVLSGLSILAVVALVRLAHRLPAAAPHDDASWGRGDVWLPHDPLPLAQLAAHEEDRRLSRAA